MLESVKDYVRLHKAEIAVFGVMATVLVGIGLAAGLSPLDALARSRHH